MELLELQSCCHTVGLVPFVPETDCNWGLSLYLALLGQTSPHWFGLFPCRFFRPIPTNCPFKLERTQISRAKQVALITGQLGIFTETPENIPIKAFYLVKLKMEKRFLAALDWFVVRRWRLWMFFKVFT